MDETKPDGTAGVRGTLAAYFGGCFGRPVRGCRAVFAVIHAAVTGAWPGQCPSVGRGAEPVAACVFCAVGRAVGVFQRGLDGVHRMHGSEPG